MRPRFLTALVLSAALALAACGGSSKTSTTTKAPTAAAFRSTLDALCIRANKAFDSASGVKAESAVVADYVPKFASLKPSAQLGPLYAHYVSVLKLESAALKDGNMAGLTQLVTTRARPLARQLGASGCVT